MANWWIHNWSSHWRIHSSSCAYWLFVLLTFWRIHACSQWVGCFCWRLLWWRLPLDRKLRLDLIISSMNDSIWWCFLVLQQVSRWLIWKLPLVVNCFDRSRSCSLRSDSLVGWNVVLGKWKLVILSILFSIAWWIWVWDCVHIVCIFEMRLFKQSLLLEIEVALFMILGEVGSRSEGHQLLLVIKLKIICQVSVLIWIQELSEFEVMTGCWFSLVHHILVVDVVTLWSLVVSAASSIRTLVEDLALSGLLLFLLSLRMRLWSWLLMGALRINWVLSHINRVVLDLAVRTVLGAQVMIQAGLRSNFKDKIIDHWLTWLPQVSFALNDVIWGIQFRFNRDLTFVMRTGWSLLDAWATRLRERIYDCTSIWIVI